MTVEQELAEVDAALAQRPLALPTRADKIQHLNAAYNRVQEYCRERDGAIALARRAVSRIRRARDEIEIEGRAATEVLQDLFEDVDDMAKEIPE